MEWILKKHDHFGTIVKGLTIFIEIKSAIVGPAGEPVLEKST